VGAFMGLLMAVVSVTMGAEQGISGIGLYLFGLGLSSLLFKTMIGSVESVSGFSSLHIPVLSDIPVIGPIFFDHSVVVYLAYLMAPVSWYLINRTTLGLKIRAAGQNPEAADSLGVSVNGVRYFTVIYGSAMAGIAGATLSIGLLNVFQVFSTLRRQTRSNRQWPCTPHPRVRSARFEDVAHAESYNRIFAVIRRARRLKGRCCGKFTP